MRRLISVMMTGAMLVGFGASAFADAKADLKAAEEAFAAGDNAKAAALVKPLAEAGNAEAQRNLAVMYRTGRGVARDEKEAVEWMRKSADQGFADAQFQLGQMYLAGEGVETDAAQAKQLFEAASSSGLIPATHALGRMAGDAGENDKAIELFEAAARAGFVPAVLDVAQAYKIRADAAGEGSGALAALSEAYKWTHVGLAAIPSGTGRDEVHRFRIQIEDAYKKSAPERAERALSMARTEGEQLLAEIRAKPPQTDATSDTAPAPSPAGN